MITVIKGNNAEISGSKRKNGQQKMCNLFCNIAEKRTE